MNYKFAERISTLRPSAIREILKHTQNPEIIPFAAGNPAPEAFCAADVAGIVNDIMQTDPVTALQYSVTEGYMPLREQVFSRLKNKKIVSADTDEVLITHGAQQVTDITAKLLLPERGRVICENPTFIGSLSAFRSYGATCVGVGFDDAGIDLYGVENALADSAAFVYVIPNFQNPTGRTMSLQRRRDLLSLCVKYDTPILEDDPYGELRFSGEDIPSIRSITVSRRQGEYVIYAGSFSKILSPGLRVGYMAADKKFTARAAAAMQTTTVHAGILAQMTAYNFFEKYGYDEHIEKLRDIYRRKYTLMRDNLAGCELPVPAVSAVEGGLFLSLKTGSDADTLAAASLAKKVAVVPGAAFAADIMFNGRSAAEEVADTIRLNYSTPSDEQIVRGCQILCGILRELQ